MNIGEILKETRLEKGLTISQVSQDLLIQEKYLLAIEEGNFDIIPGEVFQRAYFNKYAEFLGLKDYIDSITRSHRVKPEVNERPTGDIFSGPWDTARLVRVSLKILIIIVIPLVIIVSIISAGNKKDQNEEPEQVDSTYSIGVVPTESLEEEWGTGGDVDPLDSPPQFHDLNHVIILRARGECWVKLSTLDDVIYFDYMYVGQELTHTDPIGFSVNAGKPELLDVIFDGELIPWEAGLQQMNLPEGMIVIPGDN